MWALLQLVAAHHGFRLVFADEDFQPSIGHPLLRTADGFLLRPCAVLAENELGELGVLLRGLNAQHIYGAAQALKQLPRR
eukprot:9512487-Alexandrium_andersonii.AAC.1